MTAQELNSQKLQQLLNSATSERQRIMYQSLLKKAKIEEKKAQAKRQIQEKALAEAEALKAKIASNIQKQKQETGDDIPPSINLKESTSTTMTQPEKIIEAKKTKFYREYTVKEHQRKIYEREYKFVCSGCDKIVERSSYALCCPTYGMECGGKKSKCKRFTK